MRGSSMNTLGATISFLTISDSESLHAWSIKDQDGGTALLCCATGFLNAPGFADVSAKLVVTAKGSQPLNQVIPL